MTARVLSAIAAMARGEAIVVTDDADREDEGDLVMAADAVDAASIAFMAVQCRGLICLAMEPQRLDELELGPMVPGAHAETNFTVSIDFDIPGSTGISAADRARTIRQAVDPSTGPREFRRPGHVFPLRYTPGGVLSRRGHTEASVDLARLAGRAPAAVICEIMNDDGTMARGASLLDFARGHGLVVVSIDELARFIVEEAPFGSDEPAVLAAASVEEVVTTTLPTRFGRWQTTGFRGRDGLEYIVLSLGDPKSCPAPLVRVHSECLTGDALGSERCDCGRQLEMSMEKIRDEGQGVIVYVRGHEGRGIGLMPKLQAYALQDGGLDTVDANLELGYEADSRTYAGVAAVLLASGFHSIRLLTNNPQKVEALTEGGLQITQRLPLIVPLSEDNIAYLSTKRARMQHRLFGAPEHHDRDQAGPSVQLAQRIGDLENQGDIQLFTELLLHR
jgi:3,4-dihydroxy 2-butanone 4-phosphate synthase / GTP cyclohydrolase II